jgi:pyridoxal phosphate enzyme (YggS family)
MKMDTVVDIRANYQRVLERVEQAARSAGRRDDDVRVVVVTKLQPVASIRAAVESGARLFGENYAEEALPKIQALEDVTGIEWHMIGHVQSRKARLVADHFDFMHSLDSFKLAERLDRMLCESGRRLPVLLEFNLAGEASKSGWDAVHLESWLELVGEIQAIAALPSLEVRGLMTMPPLSNNPEEVRPYFRRLAHLRDFLAREVPQAHWEELSMGTSSDFEVAVQEGATLVRIGEAILGPRIKHG